MRKRPFERYLEQLTVVHVKIQTYESESAIGVSRRCTCNEMILSNSIGDEAGCVRAQSAQ